MILTFIPKSLDALLALRAAALTFKVCASQLSRNWAYIS